MVFGLIPYETNLLKYLMIFKISPQMNVIFVDFLQKNCAKKTVENYSLTTMGNRIYWVLLGNRIY